MHIVIFIIRIAALIQKCILLIRHSEIMSYFFQWNFTISIAKQRIIALHTSYLLIKIVFYRQNYCYHQKNTSRWPISEILTCLISICCVYYLCIFTCFWLNRCYFIILNSYYYYSKLLSTIRIIISTVNPIAIVVLQNNHHFFSATKTHCFLS